MRLRVIKFIFFVSLFLIVLRLGYWQIIKADELSARGEGQRLITQEVLASRGSILFSDGSILASAQPSYLVYGQPKVIAEQFLSKESSNLLSPKAKSDPISKIVEYKRGISEKLALVFWEESLKESTESGQIVEEGVKKNQIEEIQKRIFDKLNQNLFWVNLGQKVNLETKTRIEMMNLLGVGFDSSSSRFYPEGSSSAHLLGFVGSDVFGVDTGYFGIEGFYNGELKGKKGALTLEKDALGVPILIGKFLSKESRPGKTLLTNVDRTVQYMVEDNLRRGVEKYGAKGGSVIVMDPKTGGILAMASYPSYDPAKSYLYPSENHKNPIVADSYEPGSTFKVLVMASGINEKVVDPEMVCDICSGPVSLSGYTIRTWDNKYRPNLTMNEVIIHSDNTGMVFVSKKLGMDKMYEYVKKFGFGELTQVDLQDESSPSLRERKDWKEIDLATASFGQGISVTPIQIVRAVSALANGGKLMEPHVVSEIREGEKVYRVHPKIMDEPISEETAKKVTEMMVKAVDEGEAKFAKPKGFKIAGKTGTAQIAVAGHYDPTKTIASFIGFAPADDPKFVMLVRYQEPSSSIFGSETAAPTFFNIAKELFTYYNISPTEPLAKEK